MGNSYIDKALTTAKKTLQNAQNFSRQVTGTPMASPSPTMQVPNKPANKPASSVSALGESLRAKQQNVDAYAKQYPKMHNGGIIPGKSGHEVNITALAGEKVTPTHMADSGDSFPLEAKASGPGTSAASTDNSHVKTQKPIELKKRELDCAKS